MGKRRKAIRWLAAIVIVALIGGLTAVAVDRRIREQVEEEVLGSGNGNGQSKWVVSKSTVDYRRS